jgi:hypothetical protein
MLPKPFSDHTAEDLRIVTDETFIDEDGERCVAVFSIGLDALTFIDEAEEKELLELGVAVIESLPE